MEKTVNWSERSKRSFERVVYYLVTEWNDRVANNFMQETNKCIDVIAKFPFTGEETRKKKGARKTLITKHNLLVYRVHKNSITIIDIMDTRQNPKKTKY